jgi:hypothetical protein
MTSPARALAFAAASLIAWTPPSVGAQAPASEPERAAAPSAPAAARFRLVLDAAFGLAQPSFSDSRTLPEYAEQTTIRTSYEAGVGFGPDLSLQVSLYRGLGIQVGYSRLARDLTGAVDVSRPHPLYLGRPRTASAELSGYTYTESGIDLDLAFARSAGHLEWALFAGATLFQVEADMLLAPTYDETYPYDELPITATPSTTVKDSPTGFNVGGRLDYRFGSSGRFGVGVQVRYRTASVTLKAEPNASEASLDAGGLSVGAGVRVYF